MTLDLNADTATLHRVLRERCPAMPPMPPVRRQLLDYQLFALFLLAREQNRPGARILEIGTGRGGSGYVLSRAAPLATILSLTTSDRDWVAAQELWRQLGCRNISGLLTASWDYLAQTSETWDLVFIDGDHNRIARDLPWFDRLREGGLLLCHDYSPQGSRAPSAIVYEELNALAARLGRPFDVRLVDEDQVGMAGFYRRAGEMATVEVHAPPPCPPSPDLYPGATCPTAGIVLREGDPAAAQRIATEGFGVVCSASREIGTWSRVLFARSGADLPWALLPIGFGFLKQWDAAAPFSPEPLVAEQIGTGDDRARTKIILHDLRVPVYSPDLVFVRDSEPGRQLVERWSAECDGGDERLAFLRALYAVKPLFCALPRTWLSGAKG